MVAGIGPGSVPLLSEATARTLVVLAATFLAVLAVGRGLLVPAAVRLVRARNPNNPTLPQATRRYLTLLVVLVGAWVATVAAGFGAVFFGSALVVAAATLALGVAGQDVIGNLVSGVFLVTDRDFNVGDWIEWDDHAGRVEGIEFRVTRVRTAAGEGVTVPNTVLATTPVNTPYARGLYRITERLSVPYGANVAAATEHLRAAASADERVSERRPPSVDATGFGPSGVDLAVHVWVPEPRYDEVADVRTALVRRVDERCAEAGVEINPPSQHRLSGRVAVEERPADDG